MRKKSKLIFMVMISFVYFELRDNHVSHNVWCLWISHLIDLEKRTEKLRAEFFYIRLKLTCLLPRKTEQEKNHDIRKYVGEWHETFYTN